MRSNSWNKEGEINYLFFVQTCIAFLLDSSGGQKKYALNKLPVHSCIAFLLDISSGYYYALVYNCVLFCPSVK